MIKIKYVGVKRDGERAFKLDTGIEWFPGDVHEVKEEHAAQMLRHPDVFEQVTGPAVKLAPKPTLKGVAATDHDADDEAIAREDAAKDAEKRAAAEKAAAEAGSAPGDQKAPEQKAVEAVETPAKKAAPKAPAVKRGAKKK